MSEEYPNLPTLSWATWKNQEYIQEEALINPEFLREQFVQRVHRDVQTKYPTITVILPEAANETTETELMTPV